MKQTEIETARKKARYEIATKAVAVIATLSTAVLAAIHLHNC